MLAQKKYSVLLLRMVTRKNKNKKATLYGVAFFYLFLVFSPSPSPIMFNRTTMSNSNGTYYPESPPFPPPPPPPPPSPSSHRSHALDNRGYSHQFLHWRCLDRKWIRDYGDWIGGLFPRLVTRERRRNRTLEERWHARGHGADC